MHGDGIHRAVDGYSTNNIEHMAEYTHARLELCVRVGVCACVSTLDLSYVCVLVCVRV